MHMTAVDLRVHLWLAWKSSIFNSGDARMADCWALGMIKAVGVLFKIPVPLAAPRVVIFADGWQLAYMIWQASLDTQKAPLRVSRNFELSRIKIPPIDPRTRPCPCVQTRGDCTWNISQSPGASVHSLSYCIIPVAPRERAWWGLVSAVNCLNWERLSNKGSMRKWWWNFPLYSQVLALYVKSNVSSN